MGARCDSTEAARRPEFTPRDQLGFARMRGIATRKHGPGRSGHFQFQQSEGTATVNKGFYSKCDLARSRTITWATSYRIHPSTKQGDPGMGKCCKHCEAVM